MNLLVLGGTVFLGRHVAAAGLARGHRVTLFHRGRHVLEPGAFGDRVAEIVHGDRRRDLGSLAGRTWDAVIDTSAFVPSDVAGALELLGPNTRHYTFVSSISVYAGFGAEGMTEDAPLSTLTNDQRREGESLDREDPAQVARFHELYGPLKADCEREVLQRLPAASLVVRPGLIVGPYDPTDRFTYWVERAARGGELLAPGSPGRLVQFVDARDLAEWMVRLAESGQTGTFQATGPARPFPMEALLGACLRQGGAEARLTWCDDGFMLESGVRPWSELPLWLPESDASVRGLMRMDCARARDAGLTFRPLEATLRDTLDWSRARAAGEPRRAGLDAAKERELLARWRTARAGAGAKSATGSASA